jgi:hypothetical protein
MVLVTISGRKNTILENQGDSVGTLVRDVSKHVILKGLIQNVEYLQLFCPLYICIKTFSTVYESVFTLQYCWR